MVANKFWLLVLDDKSGKSWSYFLKQKDELEDQMLAFLREMKKKGTPVSFIRLDNAGEHMTLRDSIRNSPDLQVQFEFTPRDGPQYNGRCERRFAVLWNAVRPNLNSAKLPSGMRHGLWAECGRYSQIIHDHLVAASSVAKGSTYQQFHGKELPALRYIRPFGTMAVVTLPKMGKLQSKSKDKGKLMIYVGPAVDHAKDVHWFFDPSTRKTVESRDADFMDCTYGDWKGLGDPPDVEKVASMPPAFVDLEDSDDDEDVQYWGRNPQPPPVLPAAPPVPPAQPPTPPAAAPCSRGLNCEANREIRAKTDESGDQIRWTTSWGSTQPKNPFFGSDSDILCGPTLAL